MNKQELRLWVRKRKRAMTEAQIREKSVALATRFYQTEEYRNAGSIYGYLPYNQEVRTDAILCRALREGKRIALPKCRERRMEFIWLDDLDAVAKNAMGVPEPIADGPLADDENALVLMPGLAFDKEGRRIGYGGGFYDRFLAREGNHPTVALCYDFQVFDCLETEEYDIPVDLLLWE